MEESVIAANGAEQTQWITAQKVIAYEDALQIMEKAVNQIRLSQGPERIWLLEHPPLYTAGRSANRSDLLDPNRFPIYETERGGQYTYHGPGQRVAYVMIDLKKREQNIRRFVHALEGWIIRTLKTFSIDGQSRPGRVGIWVVHKDQEKKIAALGIKLRHWISFHGVALNVFPDLEHFTGIVPCGLPQYGVTSFKQLGVNVSLEEVDQALKNEWYACPFLNQISAPSL